MESESTTKNDWEAREEWEPIFQHAINLRNSGLFVEAEGKAREILAKRPSIVAVRGFLGEVLRDQGKFIMAVNEFSVVTTASPNSKFASLGLFRSLLEVGDLEEAVKEAERFLARGEEAEYRDAYNRLMDGRKR